MCDSWQMKATALVWKSSCSNEFVEVSHQAAIESPCGYAAALSVACTVGKRMLHPSFRCEHHPINFVIPAIRSRSARRRPLILRRSFNAYGLSSTNPKVQFLPLPYNVERLLVRRQNTRALL